MRPTRSGIAFFRRAVAGATIAALAGISGILPGFVSPSQAASVALRAQAGVSPQAQILTLAAPQLATSLDAVAASGATWIRIDLFWPVVEPSRGVFDWSEPDPAIKGAIARGLHVLAVPDYTPSWASSAGDPAAFAAFMTAAAKHYAPMGVQNWEIWNEPNLASNWGPAVDPAAYTATLKAARTALRAVEPKAVVVAGALSPAVDMANRSQTSPLTFLKGMYAAGARGNFDALSVHPSSFPDMPMSPDSWNTFYELPQLHQTMVTYGDSAKKIWLTEYGAPTGTSTISVTEATQANMIFQAFAAAALWSWAGPVFAYWQDSGTDLSNPYGNFGIIRTDGSPKPGYLAFESAIGMPAGAGWTPSTPAGPVNTVAQLTSGQSLANNQKVVNPTTGWAITMQGDGNLVLYDSNNVAHWSSSTWGNAGARALMQADGNLVVYSTAGKALWASNTSGHPGAFLLLRNDNKLDIGLSSGVVLWST